MYRIYVLFIVLVIMMTSCCKVFFNDSYIQYDKIMLWLSDEMGIEKAYSMPPIYYVSRSTLHKEYLKRCVECKSGTLRGLFIPGEMIYCLCDLEKEEKVKVIVHELVHYLQYLSGYEEFDENEAVRLSKKWQLK